VNLCNRVSGLLLPAEPVPARPPPRGLAVRFATHRDLPRILAIERACFFNPLDEPHWCSLVGEGRVVAAVAEWAWVGVVGHLLYRVRPGRLEVLRLAVDPRHCRRGVGAAMLGYVAGRGAKSDRRAGFALVSETLTPAHLWLKACGWRAEGVHRGQGYSGQDLYEFKVWW
jgi:ribosomal protein S18 acetylase RimI-like enzyme